MGKTLLLMNVRWPTDRYYIKKICEENNQNIEAQATYKFSKYGLRYILAVIQMQKMKLPFQWIWYEEWKRNLSQYDTIIVFYSLLNTNIINYIHKKNPSARIILYFWDSITSTTFIVPENKRQICELWSYDKSNCKTYNLQYNSQFYLPSILSPVENKYDVSIVIKDKGRYKQVKEMYDKFSKMGLKIFVRVVRDKTSKEQDEKLYGNGMEYSELLQIINESKCIVEFVKEGQEGLTLRSMESIFYQKKLITNNPKIEEEPFFCENNIMIWNNQDPNQIREFLKSDYKKIDEKIVMQYSFVGWLKNFKE